MCGIIYARKLNTFKSSDDLSTAVLKAYDNQSHRGSDGFGFIALDMYGKIHYKRTTTLSEIKKEINQLKLVEILFHHRYPTSTINLEETAHPFFITDKRLKYDYYFVHNGSVNNVDNIKDVLESKKFNILSEIKTTREAKQLDKNKNVVAVEYQTEITYNDSEILGIELALYNEGIIKTVTSTGNASLFLLAVDKITGKFVSLSFGRNEGRPLVYEKRDNYFIISSENNSDKAEIIESDLYWKYSYKDDELSNDVFPVMIKQDYKKKIFNGF